MSADTVEVHSPEHQRYVQRVLAEHLLTEYGCRIPLGDGWHRISEAARDVVKRHPVALTLRGIASQATTREFVLLRGIDEICSTQQRVIAASDPVQRIFSAIREELGSKIPMLRTRFLRQTSHEIRDPGGAGPQVQPGMKARKLVEGVLLDEYGFPSHDDPGEDALSAESWSSDRAKAMHAEARKKNSAELGRLRLLIGDVQRRVSSDERVRDFLSVLLDELIAHRLRYEAREARQADGPIDQAALKSFLGFLHC